MSRRNWRMHACTLSLCLITRARIGETLGGVECDIWRMVTWLRKEKISHLLIFPSLRKIIDQISMQDERKLSSSSKMGLGLRHGTFFLYDAVLHFWSLLATLKILTANKRHRFSTIHAFSYSYDGLAALIASILVKIPYTIHIKGPGLHVRYLTKDIARKICMTLEYPLHLLVLKRASMVLCESRETVNSLSLYIDKERISRSPPPIQIREYRLPSAVKDIVRKDLNIPRNAIVVGYTGRLAPEKNIESLIKAYSEVCKLVKRPSRLLIIGSGSLENHLKASVRKSGIQDETMFLGRRYDVNSLLQAIDIFVLPSFYEGYSTALLEAMASGKAIIASKIPSNSEILGEDCGLFFDPTDICALGRFMIKLIDDPDLVIRIGSRNRQLAERFDIDKTCESFLKILLGLPNVRACFCVHSRTPTYNKL